MSAAKKESQGEQGEVGRARLEAELKDLRAENAALKKEVAKLRHSIPRYQTGEVSDDFDQFVQSEGVLWKRAANGGVERMVYCPACRLVLLPVPSDNPVDFFCTRCHFRAPFRVQDLDAAIARVGKSLR